MKKQTRRYAEDVKFIYHSETVSLPMCKLHSLLYKLQYRTYVIVWHAAALSMYSCTDCQRYYGKNFWQQTTAKSFCVFYSGSTQANNYHIHSLTGYYIM